MARRSPYTAPGSRFAADFVSADLMAARNAYIATLSQKTNPAVGALFRSGVNDPGALLTDHGWRVVSVGHPGDRDADFGRWVGPETVGAGFFFVMAERPFPASPQEPRTA